MKKKILLVGRNRGFVSALEKMLPDAELYVIEEPQLHERQLKSKFECKSLKETRVGAYQQSEGLLETVKPWHEEVGFDAVLPGVEYAVGAAGAAARELGLRYIGAKAVRGLTNKLRLRELCRDNGVPHPRFARVESVDDVHGFFEGKKIVIKPANRQASAGVIKVERAEDIERAYAEMVATDEGHKIVDRPMTWEFMAEEYMEGFEVSVETIVQDGKVLFHNITGKTTTEGRYFVELGHVVPALLTPEQVQAVHAAQDALVAALEAQDGFLHAEWKYTPEGPKLIECAGRPAGDSILDLIELAYGFNVYAAFAQVASGEKLDLPQQASRGACIRFFQPQPGTLQEIRGAEALSEADPHLVDAAITAQPGDVIGEITSSWSRVGYVIMTGDDAEDAHRRAEELVGRVEFVV